MNHTRRQMSLLLAIALTVLLVDLVTKELATILLTVGPASFTPEEGSFRLFLTHNDGAAGGVWLGDSTRIINILAMSLVVLLAVMISRQLSAQHRLAPTAMGLIIGAALGNTVSLVLGPSVVDFIAFSTGGSEMVFNVADVALVVGIMVLVPVAISLASRIRANMRWRRRIPAPAVITARAANAIRRSLILEREVPVAFASETVALANPGNKRVEPTIIKEQRPATDSERCA